MRIHSDTLQPPHVDDAVTQLHALRRLPASTQLDPERLTLLPSTRRDHALNIVLQSTSRRWDRAHMPGSKTLYTAQFRERMWLIATLLERDPQLIAAGGDGNWYRGADHFHTMTAQAYNPNVLVPLLKSGAPDPFPYLIGISTPWELYREESQQYGRHRSDGGEVPAHERAACREVPGFKAGEEYHYMPRTVEEVMLHAFPPMPTQADEDEAIQLEASLGYSDPAEIEWWRDDPEEVTPTA